MINFSGRPGSWRAQDPTLANAKLHDRLGPCVSRDLHPAPTARDFVIGAYLTISIARRFGAARTEEKKKRKKKAEAFHGPVWTSKIKVCTSVFYIYRRSYQDPDAQNTTNPDHSYLYGASALMAAASSGSHLSPLARSFSGATLATCITNGRADTLGGNIPLL